MDERITYISDFYGYEVQSRQLIEEMAELTKAINKLWRFENGQKIPQTKGKLEAKILEEIADVEICLDYFKYLFNIKTNNLNGFVESTKDFKLNREIKRIKERLKS